MLRCPKCGSQRIDQFLCPDGPMWCLDCGFRIEDKSIEPNPFYVPDEGSDAESLPLGELLASAVKKRSLNDESS